jgi:hypothetical protein
MFHAPAALKVQRFRQIVKQIRLLSMRICTEDNLGRLEYGNQCLDPQFTYCTNGSSQSGPLRATFILVDSLAASGGTCLHRFHLWPAGISFPEWSVSPGP